MTREKMQGWAAWWAAQADISRNPAAYWLTPAMRRNAIEHAQFMAAWWAAQAEAVHS